MSNKIFTINKGKTKLIRRITRVTCVNCELRLSHLKAQGCDNAYNPCIAKNEKGNFIYPCTEMLFGFPVHYIYVKLPKS